MGLTLVKEVPQIRIYPDPSMPKFRPIIGWRRYIPIEFLKPQFFFREHKGDFYCNPDVLAIIRRRLSHGV